MSFYTKQQLLNIPKRPKQRYNRHPRHSLRMRCKKCNYKVKLGGVPYFNKIQRIMKEVEEGHKCKAEWVIERDYHAAEIGHILVEQTTQQTEGSTTSWVDISGAEITSGNFTAGEKYLLIIRADIQQTFTNGAMSIKTLHGSTDFDDSVKTLERESGNGWDTYFFLNVWTAVSSEGIKLQHRTTSTFSSHNAKTDQIQMIAIHIEELTENTDYFSNYNGTDTSLSTSWSTSNNASVTFTPDSEQDYLVLGYAQIHIDSTTTNAETRMNLDDSILTPLYSREGELTVTDIHFLARVHTLDASEHTISIQCRNDETTADERYANEIFVLRLGVFDAFSSSYTATKTLTDSSAYEVQIDSDSFDAGGTHDVFHFAFGILDDVDNCQLRTQVEGTDEPATQTSDAYEFDANFDTTDQWGYLMMSITNVTTGSKAYDFDGDGDNPIIDVQLLELSMELAGAGGVTLSDAKPTVSAIIG